MNAGIETAAVTSNDVADWRSEVQRAARDLAAAIAETPEFQAFDLAYTRFREDEQAQRALQAYETFYQSIQPMLMLGAVSEEQREELERLRQAWLAAPSMAEYEETQAPLEALARSIDELLSERIGLGFATACRPGCCG